MWLGADSTAQTPSGVSPDTQDPNSITGIISSLAPLATTVMTALDQQKLLDYNMQLIAQGKPPLTPDQLVALQSGSAPAVALGLTQGTTNVIEDIAIGGGLLIAAIFVINLLAGGISRDSQRRMSHAYSR